MATRFFTWTAMAEAARRREFAESNADALRMMLRWRNLPAHRRLKRLIRCLNVWTAKVVVRKRKLARQQRLDDAVAAAAAAAAASRHASAVLVQAAWRGFNARSHMLYHVHRDRIEAAVVRIQCAWRSALARRERNKRTQARVIRQLKRTRAAIKIQRVARGHAARERVKELRAVRRANGVTSTLPQDTEISSAAAVAAAAAEEAAAAEAAAAAARQAEFNAAVAALTAAAGDDSDSDLSDNEVLAAAAATQQLALTTQNFLSQAQNRAACKIQAAWRGRCGRKDADKHRRLRDALRQRQREGWSGFQVYSEVQQQQQQQQQQHHHQQQQHSHLQYQLQPDSQYQQYQPQEPQPYDVDHVAYTAVSEPAAAAAAVSYVAPTLPDYGTLLAALHQGDTAAYGSGSSEGDSSYALVSVSSQPSHAAAVESYHTAGAATPVDAAAALVPWSGVVHDQYYGYDSSYFEHGQQEYDTQQHHAYYGEGGYDTAAMVQYGEAGAGAGVAPYHNPATTDATSAVVPYGQEAATYGYDGTGYGAEYTAAYIATEYDAAATSDGSYYYDAQTGAAEGSNYYGGAASTDAAADDGTLAAQWAAYYASMGMDGAMVAAQQQQLPQQYDASYYGYSDATGYESASGYDHSAYAGYDHSAYQGYGGYQ